MSKTNMINFLPLGGANEIGANCYYLNINGIGIILDCGMHPQKKGLDALPDFNLLENLPLDYVLISHAHQDHLSSLPFLIKKFPYLKIITTPQTRALAEVTLHNSVSILKGQINEEGFEIYNHDEIDLLIRMIDYKAYNEAYELKSFYNQNEIKVEFFDAGHILGSAGILIEGEQTVFYSGDINLVNQPLLTAANLPHKKIDTLIIESTYGSIDSSTLLSWENETKRLAVSLNKIINSGGSVLIPVFALGKTQEILRTLWNLISKNRIANVDIYLGGIASKINRVYDYNRYVVNMNEPDFELSSIPTKNLYEIENAADFFKSPCIVLASSGMMIEGTASYNLALHWMKRKNSAIFIVGYMDKSTPGFKIANAVKGDKIRLSEFCDEEEIKCTIEKFRFTAHSNREGLLDIVRKLKPENVILVHGEEESINWMGENILKEFKGVKVFAPEMGREIKLE